MRSVPSAIADGSKSAKRRRGKDGASSPQVKLIKKPRSPDIIEAEIAEVELRLSALSEEMARPEIARDITQLVKVNDDYQEAESRLAELMLEWERSATTAG